MPQRAVELLSPLGGLHRSVAVQSQPPFTTPDALNVRPRGPFGQRMRVGSRPGMDKAGFSSFTPPVDMLDVIEPFYPGDDGGAGGDRRASWKEDFGGTALGDFWTAVSGGFLPPLRDGHAVADQQSIEYRVARAAMPSGFSASVEYQTELLIVPVDGQYNGFYRLWGLMHNTNPNPIQNGILVSIRLLNGDYRGSMQFFSGSLSPQWTVNFTPGDIGYIKPLILRLKLVSGGTATAELDSTVLATRGFTVNPLLHGQRVGFALNRSTSSIETRVGHFRLSYTLAAGNDTPRRRVVCAAAGGRFYHEEYRGKLVEFSQPHATVKTTLRSGGRLASAEYNGRLYIADYSDKSAFSGDGADWSAFNRTLSDGSTFSGAAFLAAVPFGVDALSADRPRDHYIRLRSASEPALNGDFRVASRSGDNLAFYPEPQVGANVNDIEYEFWRGPKVYRTDAFPLFDGPLPTLEQVGYHHEIISLSGPTFRAINGNVPASCRLMAFFSDRLFLAGQIGNPHIWYASWKGDPERFEIIDDDPRSAVFGTTAEASTGVPPQAINALIAHSDDYLLMGCERSLWLLRGDPVEGGRLDNLSRTDGIVGGKAWAVTPEGYVVFLSHDGLNGLPPGAAAVPEPVSRGRLPEELLNLSARQFDPIMEYDAQGRGVHIFLVGRDVVPGQSAPAVNPQQHWWFDWDTKGFWPVRVPNSFPPTAVTIGPSPLDDRSVVLLAGLDGHIRQFVPEQKSDGGTVPGEYVVFGPIRLGNMEREGLILHLRAVMAEDGGKPIYRIILGRTAEEAFLKLRSGDAGHSVGDLPGGRSVLHHPRARGAYAVIKVGGSGRDTHWAIESLALRLKVVGRMREVA